MHNSFKNTGSSEHRLVHLLGVTANNFETPSAPESSTSEQLEALKLTPPPIEGIAEGEQAATEVLQASEREKMQLWVDVSAEALRQQGDQVAQSMGRVNQSALDKQEDLVQGLDVKEINLQLASLDKINAELATAEDDTADLWRYVQEFVQTSVPNETPMQEEPEEVLDFDDPAVLARLDNNQEMNTILNNLVTELNAGETKEIDHINTLVSHMKPQQQATFKTWLKTRIENHQYKMSEHGNDVVFEAMA